MSTYTTDRSAAGHHRSPQGRGPVRVHDFSTLTNNASRALNPMERSKEAERINQAMDEQIERAKQRASVKHLRFIRKQLKGFDLHGHQVWIEASMGTCGVRIESRRSGKQQWAHELQGAGRSVVAAVLQEIDQYLDYDWACFLDGELLAP